MGNWRRNLQALREDLIVFFQDQKEGCRLERDSCLSLPEITLNIVII